MPNVGRGGVAVFFSENVSCRYMGMRGVDAGRDQRKGYRLTEKIRKWNTRLSGGEMGIRGDRCSPLRFCGGPMEGGHAEPDENAIHSCWKTMDALQCAERSSDSMKTEERMK